ncbi:1-phosphofructokinase family hexose kinase [Glaciibacter sp. 2TAF33]|uniref:1-phosphofructokinase family hexose kinase n=1 Tax=Glaciibacter sp. 2TAF33 TaxID=3233015 RepID=UPI003F93C120
MIITVTPNPALDLTYALPEIDLGESHRVPTAIMRAGGKGLNVARVLHQTGRPVLAVTAVGGLPGDEFAAELAASGVPHHLVRVSGTTRRTIAFVEHGAEHGRERAGEERDDGRTGTGERTTNFNERGQDHTPAEWQHLTDAITPALGAAECLVGSGSLPAGADPRFFAGLVSLARATGLPSVIDTSGDALLAAAEAGATVVKPNQRELAEATGDADPVRSARRLLALGAGLVLVSLGPAGMLAVSSAAPHGIWRARLPRALRGNPTGAGDAAVAAAAAALTGASQAARTRANTVADALADPTAILRLATAWSAAAVLMPLAGEISPDHESLAADVAVDYLLDTAFNGDDQ